MPAFAYIVAVSFPQTLRECLEQEVYYRGSLHHIILDCAANGYELDGWSAPPWSKPGDIAFFYATKRSLIGVRRALSSVTGRHRKLRAFLEECERLFSVLSGCIFAAGKVVAEPFRDDAAGAHYSGKLYAPMGVPVAFVPLPIEAIPGGISVKRAATITSLSANEFGSLRRALSKQQHLPDFLTQADVRDVSIAVGAGWRDVIRQGSRFRDETALRGAVIDGFLAEIAPLGAMVSKEVSCIKRQRRTGQADYVVHANGKALAVEAKLNARTEKAIEKQLKKYLGAQSLQVSGQHISLSKPIDRLLCIDQHGVRIVSRERGVVPSPVHCWQTLVEMNSAQLRARYMTDL